MALASFEFVLLPEKAGQSIIWRHFVLVGWAIAGGAYVAFRSRSGESSDGLRITDVLVGAAAAYAAVALVAEVLTDVHREIETFRGSILWQILILVELVLLFEGTRRIIDVTIPRCRVTHWEIE